MNRGVEEVIIEAVGAGKEEVAAKCKEAEGEIKVGKEVDMHLDKGDMRKKTKKMKKVRISVILAEKEDTGLENVLIEKIHD